MYDAVWLNANIARMTPESPYGAIRDGAIAVKGGAIAWVGPRAEWHGDAHVVHDVNGAWITPGLIDCHTHLVYAGNRANEFELRLTGASYEDIAQAGGGIVSTVKRTRDATQADLEATAQKRLLHWQREGVTIVEVKSGYGLATEPELKMLRAARNLSGVTVRTTLLGAHALPEEYKGRSGEYIDLVCDEMIPAAAKEQLADAVDVFCERIGFTPAETTAVFEAAQRHGLPVKLHADQLSDLGGAALAARFKALSADHMEYSNALGIGAMSTAQTVAVLLPGAFYFLRETKLPPIELLRRHRVPIAIATDHNPGSSPMMSVLLALSMACTLFRLTPEEALAGMTRCAAKALGMVQTHGTIEAGKRADFAIWDIGAPVELAYLFGANPCLGVVRAGQSTPVAS